MNKIKVVILSLSLILSGTYLVNRTLMAQNKEETRGRMTREYRNSMNEEGSFRAHMYDEEGNFRSHMYDEEGNFRGHMYDEEGSFRGHMYDEEGNFVGRSDGERASRRNNDNRPCH